MSNKTNRRLYLDEFLPSVFSFVVKIVEKVLISSQFIIFLFYVSLLWSNGIFSIYNFFKDFQIYET